MAILCLSMKAVYAKASITLYLTMGRAPCGRPGARGNGRLVMSCPEGIFHWSLYLLWWDTFLLPLWFLLHLFQGTAPDYKTAQLNLECPLEHQPGCPTNHVRLSSGPLALALSFLVCITWLWGTGNFTYPSFSCLLSRSYLYLQNQTLTLPSLPCNMGLTLPSVEWLGLY